MEGETGVEVGNSAREGDSWEDRRERQKAACAENGGTWQYGECVCWAGDRYQAWGRGARAGRTGAERTEG